MRSLLKAKAYADAVKAAAERELRIAREIQMGLLPADLPSRTRGTGLYVHAVLEPARQVGGEQLVGKNEGLGPVRLVHVHVPFPSAPLKASPSPWAWPTTRTGVSPPPVFCKSRTGTSMGVVHRSR